MASTSIPGIAMNRVTSEQGSYLWFQSEIPLRTLNSSPWGGGFGRHQHVVNRQVGKSYHAEDPLAEMSGFLLQEGLNPAATAGMLTAAWVKDVGVSSLSWEAVKGSDGGDGGAAGSGALQVCAYVTVGLGNKARAGAELPAHSLYPGTINIILLIDGQLTDAAMVNAVITATEAKAAALQDLNVHKEGRVATGTTTDAVLIAATDRGRMHAYAGTATQLGYLIGRTVYEATMASALLYEKSLSHFPKSGN
ncbi:adenosylcobinamide amidohydrolase [Paenibacillus aestuarii]|uniref:Adenosylcobinamide amidohydrolase n=1 Tax=Paenibacillus aestuarii TaxID=516965 RepID=A0ABW0KH23_9BACL|nr:adenosylcobinamide amidohydrolase [Paenibacillus aestuarii]